MRHFLFAILSSASLLLTTIALLASGNIGEVMTMTEVLLAFAIVILIALAVTQRFWNDTRSVET